jgi:hypothetical protein
MILKYHFCSCPFHAERTILLSNNLILLIDQIQAEESRVCSILSKTCKLRKFADQNNLHDP